MRKSLLFLIPMLAAIAGLLWAGLATRSTAAADEKEKVWLIDNFDGDGPSTKTTWGTYCDSNKLGTKLTPMPFEVEKGGSPKSPKGHAHISGHFGESREPWPFAQLIIKLNPDGPKDMSAYKSVRFYAKGDARTYKIILCKAAVKDYGDYEFKFEAPKEWTLITCPLDKFEQPEWGMAVPKDFKDATEIKFSPTANDEDFDLRLDDIEFVEKPAK